MGGNNDSLSVLFVHGSDARSKSTKQYLEHNGDFSVHTAHTGRDGLKKLSAGRYDVIVCSDSLPDMEGTGFISDLRRAEIHIPFILFSETEPVSAVLNTLHSVAGYYLPKNGNPADWNKELRQMIILAAGTQNAGNHTENTSEKHGIESGLLNILPEAIFATDTTGTVTLWNRTLEEMFGVPASEMVGKGDSAYSIPFYGEKRPMLLDFILKNDPGILSLYENVHQNGDYIRAETYLPGWDERKGAYLSVVALPVRDTAGNLTGALESVRDISRQKKAEILFKKSDERHKSILEEQTEFVCRFTPDGKYSYVNEAFCRYFGKNRDDLLGQRFKPLMPEEERKKVGNHFDTLTPQHPSVSFREHTLGPDGADLWQHWNTRAFFDEQGALLEYQSVGRDITGVVTSEKALKNSEEAYRAIFENTGNASIIYDADTTILLANTEFERLSGYRKDQLEGKKSWTDFVAPGDLPMMIKYHQNRLKDSDKVPETYDYRAFDKDNNLKYIAVTVGELPDKDRYIASLIDVTSIRKMQVALDEANNKLRLLTSITRHDIANKITALFMMLELLRAENPSPEMTEKIDIIDKLTEDINEEIMFTRNYEELGQKEPLWQGMDMIIAGLDIPPEISLKSSLDPVEIYADMMLRIVFQNLVDNSVRHGNGVTEIRLSSAETERALIITYEDNGTGVVPEMKSEIFRRDVGENTGLGLFLACDILALTGISIRETGVPGTCARFEMTVSDDCYRIPE